MKDPNKDQRKVTIKQFPLARTVKRWSKINNPQSLFMLCRNGAPQRTTDGQEDGNVGETLKEINQKGPEMWSSKHRTHDAANSKLWQSSAVNHAPDADANTIAKNIRVESPTRGARFHLTQFGEFADTSTTHWHVNPQTSPLLWDFLWTLLARLHQRASHGLISRKHEASARQQTAASVMATYKAKSLCKWR